MLGSYLIQIFLRGHTNWNRNVNCYYIGIMKEMQSLFSAPIVARCRAQANSGKADDAKRSACAAYKNKLAGTIRWYWVAIAHLPKTHTPL